MAAGFVQSPVPDGAGWTFCPVVVNCAVLMSSAGLHAICASAAVGAIAVNAVAAVAVPRKPRRVVLTTDSFDMKRSFPRAQEYPKAQSWCLRWLHSMNGLSLCREVVPKVVEAIRAAKQSGEYGQVRQQDMAGSRAGRRHPEEHVEFGIAGFGKWMWLRQIDRLPSQQADGVCVLSRQRVVRQVLVKIERCHVLQPTRLVEIAHDCEGSKLVGPADHGRAKAKPIFHRHPETFH